MPEASKRTEIGDVPEDWDVSTLGLICEEGGGCIQTGPFGSQLHANEYEADGVPVINPTHLEGDRINHSSVPRVSPETSRRLRRHHVEAGDILFGRRGEIGRHGLVSDDEAGWLCGTGCFVVRVRHPKVDNAFLSYLFSTGNVIEWLTAHAAGTIMPNLNNTVMSDLPVVLPTISEQRKLVAILSNLRRTVETESAICDKFAALKSGLLTKLFREGLRGESQKETAIGPVPQNWRVGRLVEFAHFQRGYDITKKDQKHGTVPVVSSGGIRSWHDEATAKGPGVVIGRKGSIGELYYIEQDYWPHDTTLFATDFCGNVPLFVYYRLSVLDLKRLDSGAANPALNRNFLHEEVLSWPDADEQGRIATILQTIDHKASVHARKRDTMQNLFKAMLHQFMTGAIRVRDLDLAEVSNA